MDVRIGRETQQLFVFSTDNDIEYTPGYPGDHAPHTFGRPIPPSSPDAGQVNGARALKPRRISADINLAFSAALDS